MSAAVGKTPVSVLQELLSRRGTTPKYELVQIEGAIHEPTFRYRVTVADVVGMYEDKIAWLHCSVLLRLWFFKCVV
jgi:dsRNA-specific ribonuclease